MMENCVVCLNTNEDVLSRITTTSVEWIENKMQKIIEKHLWWWYLGAKPKNLKRTPWICRQCWQEISAFHDFYKNVEKAHKYYQTLLLMNQIKKEQEIPLDNQKIEQVLETNLDILINQDNREENLRKQNNSMEKIEIEEIKSENCSFLLNERIVDMNVIDENSVSTDCISKDVEISQPESNKAFIRKKKSIERIKLQERNNHKSTITTSKKLKAAQNITKKKNLESKIYQVDNFFREIEHNLECCICNVSLSDFRSIKAHYRNEHNTRGYALCCGKKYFKRCLLVDHLRVHKDPNFFKCESCLKSFETRRGLELHVDIHKVRERKYNCDECGKSYFKLNIYQRHKLTHLPDIDKKFKCSQCEKKFASDDMRRRHEDSTHDRKKIKICDICGKSFCFGYSFLRHMEEHAGIPQSMVTCDICGVKLTNKYGLRQHIKMRHMEENLQEQICPYCSRVSPNLNAHRKHIKYSHTMQRNHACHLCEKAFRRPLELKEHISTHTGEALYTCPHCPRTFISNANMYKHHKTAHRMEWEENRLSKRRDNNLACSSATSGDKEVVPNGTLSKTDRFIGSFTKYLKNIDN